MKKINMLFNVITIIFIIIIVILQMNYQASNISWDSTKLITNFILVFLVITYFVAIYTKNEKYFVKIYNYLRRTFICILSCSISFGIIYIYRNSMVLLFGPIVFLGMALMTILASIIIQDAIDKVIGRIMPKIYSGNNYKMKNNRRNSIKNFWKTLTKEDKQAQKR